MKAEGTFEVTMHGEPPYDTVDGVSLSRASVTKRFVGGLTATSTVHMLAVRTAVKDSAAYVAIERIVAGLEKKNRVLNEHERTVVAYHEMGHALVAMGDVGSRAACQAIAAAAIDVDVQYAVHHLQDILPLLLGHVRKLFRIDP